jgi:hypothetical protein
MADVLQSTLKTWLETLYTLIDSRCALKSLHSNGDRVKIKQML